MPLAPRRRARSNVVAFPERVTPLGRYNGRTVPVTDAQPARRHLERFRLGEWLVVPAEGRLLAGEETRRLEPRTMDVLVCLAERAGAVVSKNALIDAVWAGGYISEGTLTNAVAELRAALDDDARHPRFIETIPKRGYRLVVPAVAEDAVDEPQVEVRTRSPFPTLRSAGTSLAIAAAAAALLLLWPRADDTDPRRVFVVPLVNRTGDPSLDAIGQLAADRLTAELSASNFTEPVPAGDAPTGWDVAGVSSAARAHGSGLALTGSYYLHEGRVEVQIRLIDVEHEEVLYAVPSEISPREGSNQALDRAVQRALGAVATHLRGHSHSQLMSRPPLFEAYKEFVAGSMLWGADYPESVRHLERAVALDPGFVSAQLRLAMGYRVLGRTDDAIAVVAGLQRHRQELTEFEQLWVDLFAAWFDGRLEDRLPLLRQIEAMAPGDVVVEHLMAASALALNRPREALAVFGGAAPEDAPEWLQRASFFAVLYEDRTSAYHRIGRFEEELAVARAGLRRFPSDPHLRDAELRALGAMGDREGLEQALSDAASSPSRGIDPCHFMIEAAASARAHGHPAVAQDLSARALGDLASRPAHAEDPQLMWIAAQAHVYRGDLNRARPILEELRSRFPEFSPHAVARWLGVVAARQGDVARAAALDLELRDDMSPRSEGTSSFSRAAIAAWLGRRQLALDLLRQAHREGWGDFSLLHDTDRILFEPLLGEPAFEAMLHPTG